MTDEQILGARYREFYRAAIRKGGDGIRNVLAECFTLTHMTGMVQDREEYIRYIENGTLNYYSEEPVALSADIHGNTARLRAQSLVEAAVFGGGRRTWRLQLDMEAEKTDGVWRFTGAAASTF